MNGESHCSCGGEMAFFVTESNGRAEETGEGLIDIEF
jgi:hypothetical protein